MLRGYFDTYTATAQGRNGAFDVMVTFSDTVITDITVGYNMETPGIGSEAPSQISRAIILAQDTEVDVLTGATVTSSALIAAVEDCINQVKA